MTGGWRAVKDDSFLFHIKRRGSGKAERSAGSSHLLYYFLNTVIASNAGSQLGRRKRGEANSSGMSGSLFNGNYRRTKSRASGAGWACRLGPDTWI